MMQRFLPPTEAKNRSSVMALLCAALEPCRLYMCCRSPLESPDLLIPSSIVANVASGSVFCSDILRPTCVVSACKTGTRTGPLCPDNEVLARVYCNGGQFSEAGNPTRWCGGTFGYLVALQATDAGRKSDCRPLLSVFQLLKFDSAWLPPPRDVSTKITAVAGLYSDARFVPFSCTLRSLR